MKINANVNANAYDNEYSNENAYANVITNSYDIQKQISIAYEEANENEYTNA